MGFVAVGPGWWRSRGRTTRAGDGGNRLCGRGPRPCVTVAAAERIFHADLGVALLLRSSIGQEEEDDDDVGGELVLSREESQHVRSRRVASGMEVELFDGRGGVARCELMGFQGRLAKVKVAEVLPVRTPPLSITAAVAFPKASRGDWLVEKLAELGVAQILPVVAERSVAQVKDNRVERWQRLAISACKQCRRDLLPTFLEPRTVAELAPWVQTQCTSAAAVALLASFTGASIQQQDTSNASSLIFIVGPEGGFTPQEETLLIQ